MLKLSSCLPMMFGGIDFYDKFKAAKNAGLDFVEFWGWSGYEIDKIKSSADNAGVKIVTACVDSTDEQIRNLFNAKKLLTREEEAMNAFYKSCEESIKFAKKLGLSSLIVTVGQERNNVTRYEQHANIVLNLKKVAKLFEDNNIDLVVEPLNVLSDHIGYFLPSSYETFAICEEVGSPNIKVLYDIYHQQISEGNLIPTINKNINLIGHFHVADVPGRHEPGSGEINYKNVFKAIDKLNYNGFIGLEYSPSVSDKTEETIAQVINLAK